MDCLHCAVILWWLPKLAAHVTLVKSSLTTCPFFQVMYETVCWDMYSVENLSSCSSDLGQVHSQNLPFFRWCMKQFVEICTVWRIYRGAQVTLVKSIPKLSFFQVMYETVCWDMYSVENLSCCVSYLGQVHSHNLPFFRWCMKERVEICTVWIIYRGAHVTLVKSVLTTFLFSDNIWNNLLQYVQCGDFIMLTLVSRETYVFIHRQFEVTQQ